jgi:hypothetical protein
MVTIEVVVTLLGVLTLVIERIFSLVRETKNSECRLGGHRVIEVKNQHFEKGEYKS